VPRDAVLLDLVVGIKHTAACCRILPSQEPITLLASGLWRAVPGEIFTVQARKR